MRRKPLKKRESIRTSWGSLVTCAMSLPCTQVCGRKTTNERGILDIGILTGQVNVWNANTGIIKSGPDAGKRVDLETGAIITIRRPG